MRVSLHCCIKSGSELYFQGAPRPKSAIEFGLPDGPNPLGNLLSQ